MKKYFPQGITSVQKNLNYDYVSKREVYDLQRQIFDFLKRQIEISRASLENDGKPLRTNWNRISSEKIENILREYDTIYLSYKISKIDVQYFNNYFSVF